MVLVDVKVACHVILGTERGRISGLSIVKRDPQATGVALGGPFC